MKDCYDNDKIVAYIDNELSRQEKEKFEEALKNDSNLLNEYESIKNLKNTLRDLPKIETDSNFMVKLNEKIDNYENSNKSKWTNIFVGIFNDKSPLTIGLSAFSVILIITLSIFMMNSTSTNSENNLIEEHSAGTYLKNTTTLNDNQTIPDESEVAEDDEDDEDDGR